VVEASSKMGISSTPTETNEAVRKPETMPFEFRTSNRAFSRETVILATTEDLTAQERGPAVVCSRAGQLEQA
jgi:hypothetical protein